MKKTKIIMLVLMLLIGINATIYGSGGPTIGSAAGYWPKLVVSYAPGDTIFQNSDTLFLDLAAGKSKDYTFSFRNNGQKDLPFNTGIKTIIKSISDSTIKLNNAETIFTPNILRGKTFRNITITVSVADTLSKLAYIDLNDYTTNDNSPKLSRIYIRINKPIIKDTTHYTPPPPSTFIVNIPQASFKYGSTGDTDTLAYITNIGSTDLIVSDIQIGNTVGSVFSTTVSNLQIHPGKTGIIPIQFSYASTSPYNTYKGQLSFSTNKTTKQFTTTLIMVQQIVVSASQYLQNDTIRNKIVWNEYLDKNKARGFLIRKGTGQIDAGLIVGKSVSSLTNSFLGDSTYYFKIDSANAYEVTTYAGKLLPYSSNFAIATILINGNYFDNNLEGTANVSTCGPFTKLPKPTTGASKVSFDLSPTAALVTLGSTGNGNAMILLDSNGTFIDGFSNNNYYYGWNNSLSNLIPGNQFMLSNLTPGTRYKFKILVINGSGPSCGLPSYYYYVQGPALNLSFTTPVSPVIKSSQTITFPSIPTKSVTDEPFTLNATANSGLPITYASSNPAVATLNGNVVTIVGTGTASISATQTGNANFSAAPIVRASLTVSIVKAQQTITFNALPSKAVTDAPFTLTAIASSGLPITYSSSNTAVATISGDVVTIVGVGSTTIAAAQYGNANFSAAPIVRVNLVVGVTAGSTKSSQSITFNPLPVKLVTDAPFTLTATASSGLPIIYSSSNTAIATINGDVVTIVGPGTAIIAAAQYGNASFSPIIVRTALIVKNVPSSRIAYESSDSMAVENLTSPIVVTTYPNPIVNSESLFVVLTGDEFASVKIFDLNGIEINEVTYLPRNELVVPANFGSGIYVMEVITKTGTVKRIKLSVY